VRRSVITTERRRIRNIRERDLAKWEIKKRS
jgi:hypothetical protein